MISSFIELTAISVGENWAIEMLVQLKSVLAAVLRCFLPTMRLMHVGKFGSLAGCWRFIPRFLNYVMVLYMAAL